MGSRTDEFATTLRQDVETVYLDGFTVPVEPLRLPALSELALAILPEAADLDEAVEQALHRAIRESIQELLGVFKKSSAKKIGLGVRQLLGVIEAEGKGREARRNRAGPLLGFPSGDEGLRKGRHKRQPVIDLTLDVLTEHLAAISRESGFVYSGRYAMQGQPRVDSPSWLPSPELAAKFELLDRYLDSASNSGGDEQFRYALGTAIAPDIIDLWTHGFAFVRDAPYYLIPKVTCLAYVCVSGQLPTVRPSAASHAPLVDWSSGHPNQLLADDLEALLLWSVMRTKDGPRRAALAALSGLGEAIGLPYDQRCKLASDRLGLDEPDGVFRSGAWNELGGEFLDPLVLLGLSSEFSNLFYRGDTQGSESLWLPKRLL